MEAPVLTTVSVQTAGCLWFRVRVGWPPSASSQSLPIADITGLPEHPVPTVPRWLVLVPRMPVVHLKVAALCLVLTCITSPTTQMYHKEVCFTDGKTEVLGS